MAKFVPYPKYKDSGIEWIGDVPDGWEISEIKWLYDRKKITNNHEKELLSVYRDFGVIPKASRDDNYNKASEDLTPYQLVEIGDLVTNKMKTWQGSIAISEYEGIVSPAYYVYKSCHNNHNKYLHYLFRSKPYILFYGVISKGIRVNQWDLEHEAFRLTQVLLPSLSEQQAIAAFLDRETTHIDTLISKKNRLIELLKEKRQATIIQAVTKGLDANAKMKDSGIEWIGEIPEGWRLSKIKFEFENLDNFRQPISASDREGITGVYDYYGASGVIDKINKYIFDETVLLIGEDGANLAMRNLPIIYKATGKFWVNNHAHILRPINKNNLEYWFFQLELVDLTNYIRGATQPKLTQENLERIPIAIPPVQEQQAIAAYLDTQCAKLGTLIAKTEQSITLLKEKRTALITAAVTGKIDVREAVC